ncbi:hypothetical protein K438DRAFT_1838271 [Mycena galopus ATCC 62051]|nr:hypothetical protein K438DRAFT_1838271 [Mycena galopus ATCC 62051]
MSRPIFCASSTAEEVSTALAGEIRGKNVLITGTSLGGIGFEAARAIAMYASLVIITGYNLERLRLAEDAIKQEVPSANIRTLELDLSSLSSVRKAAGEINNSPEPLHVLIHNAAAVIGPFKLTVDNYESQAATDHIAPFLLTKLLAPKLLSAGTTTYIPRVVFTSSGAHAAHTGEFNFSSLKHPDREAYSGPGAYFQCKSANVLTAIELSKRSKGRINAYSLHPGVILTNLVQKEQSIPDLQAMGILGPDGQPSTERFSWKTIPEGAATTVAAAFDPRLDGVPGAYLQDCVEANKNRAAHSADPVTAETLWSVTEEIIGERFTF